MADREGAIHTIEAMLASLLLLSTLALLSEMQPDFSRSEAAHLSISASDLLNVLERRDDRPGHPSLATVLSSPDAWESGSGTLEADLKKIVPPGIRCYMSTPYGAIGEAPPDRVIVHVRPFQAYRRDAGRAIECTLILWGG